MYDWNELRNVKHIWFSVSVSSIYLVTRIEKSFRQFRNVRCSDFCLFNLVVFSTLTMSPILKGKLLLYASDYIVFSCPTGLSLIQSVPSSIDLHLIQTSSSDECSVYLFTNCYVIVVYAFIFYSSLILRMIFMIGISLGIEQWICEYHCYLVIF